MATEEQARTTESQSQIEQHMRGTTPGAKTAKKPAIRVKRLQNRVPALKQGN